MSEEKKYPIPAVGAVIYNEEGKVLLCRGPKFGDWWVIPGGKVETGEDPAVAVVREVKEELGVKIGEVEFLNFQNALNPEHYHVPVHFLYIEYAAKILSGELRPSEEIVEFSWFQPEDALVNLKLTKPMKTLLNKFLEKKQSIKSVQNEDYKASWQRALADYQNLKKETETRRSEWAQYSEQMILEEFIPVYQHLKLAINNEQLSNNKDPWLQGVRHVAKQFDSILKAHNVVEIKTVGDMFDPKFHETVGEEVSDKEHGTILREVDGGYTMGGRVIKVAKVIVAK